MSTRHLMIRCNIIIYDSCCKRQEVLVIRCPTWQQSHDTHNPSAIKKELLEDALKVNFAPFFNVFLLKIMTIFRVTEQSNVELFSDSERTIINTMEI